MNHDQRSSYNAYIEAQGVGKDPSLCNIASPFAKDLIDCQVCIGVNSKNSTSFGDLGPEFQQYLDLCNQVQTVTYATTITYLNGDVELVTLTKTTTGAMNYAPTTSTPSASTSRRRRRANQAAIENTSEAHDEYTKAQLHSDSLPPKPAIELEGSYPDPIPEMSANEIAAQEMIVLGLFTGNWAEYPGRHHNDTLSLGAYHPSHTPAPSHSACGIMLTGWPHRRSRTTVERLIPVAKKGKLLRLKMSASIITSTTGATFTYPTPEPSMVTYSARAYFMTSPSGPCIKRLNALYIYIQAIGKQPLICHKDAHFQTEYEDCINCLHVTVEDSATYISKRVEPKFKEYLDYCNGKPPDWTYAPSRLTVVTRAHWGPLTDFYGELVAGGLQTITATELKPTDSSETGGGWPSSSSTETGKTPGAGDSGNSAWIAGPVIGVITAIMLLLGALWFLRRRRHRAVDKEESMATGIAIGTRGGGYGQGGYEKPQLHSDCIPRRMELEGSYPNSPMSPMSEMTANEVAAQELSVPGSQHVEGVTEKSSSARPESPVLG
ncbi:hypothetical protein CABS01_03404 [Colletotrichum abscissum]|uniref:uncharacterized protein n=1 Tax=Colletotrichum abscissum TaxID=1671311 RepID=UPI0027D6C1B8|nr:uncharacterized protein CABS01_03404 [Colletotrichum abscissum]KAK1478102.1 hypothetical protein CABS01_03404 [Colletotrichum abscissum]